MRHNIGLNFGASTAPSSAPTASASTAASREAICARELRWGTPDVDSFRDVDVVLGADLTYDLDALPVGPHCAAALALANLFV